MTLVLQIIVWTILIFALEIQVSESQNGKLNCPQVSSNGQEVTFTCEILKNACPDNTHSNVTIFEKHEGGTGVAVCEVGAMGQATCSSDPPTTQTPNTCGCRQNSTHFIYPYTFMVNVSMNSQSYTCKRGCYMQNNTSEETPLSISSDSTCTVDPSSFMTTPSSPVVGPQPAGNQSKGFFTKVTLEGDNLDIFGHGYMTTYMVIGVFAFVVFVVFVCACCLNKYTDLQDLIAVSAVDGLLTTMTGGELRRMLFIPGLRIPSLTTFSSKANLAPHQLAPPPADDAESKYSVESSVADSSAAEESSVGDNESTIN